MAETGKKKTKLDWVLIVQIALFTIGAVLLFLAARCRCRVGCCGCGHGGYGYYGLYAAPESYPPPAQPPAGSGEVYSQPAYNPPPPVINNPQVIPGGTTYVPPSSTTTNTQPPASTTTGTSTAAPPCCWNTPVTINGMTLTAFDWMQRYMAHGDTAFYRYDTSGSETTCNIYYCGVNGVLRPNCQLMNVCDMVRRYGLEKPSSTQPYQTGGGTLNPGSTTGTTYGGSVLFG